MKTTLRIFPRCPVLATVIPAVLLLACGDSGGDARSVETTEPHAAEEGHGEVHWGYENDNGPAVWASMKPEWALCGEGRHQSPVDLNNPVESELPAIAVHTLSQQAVEVLNQNEVLEELDNGHTVQVNALLPDALQIEGKSYSLKQFHFHSPSEHTVDGEHFPMEIHFVNEADDGSLAVLGILVSEGAENPAIGSLWAALPQTHGDTTRTELPEAFAESLLTGADNGFFHYSGSLTTPPCTEGVKWMIKRTPTEISAAQIQSFRAIYDHNNRPTNPLNDRELYVDSSPSIRLYD